MNNQENNKKKNSELWKEYPNTKRIHDLIKENGRLLETLTVEEINLPNRAAYKISEEINNLKTTQLRKFFSMIKEVENTLEEDDGFNKAKKKLFAVLPLIAYSAGRSLCPKEFYLLLTACISNESLGKPEDIKTFINFMEAIVAYTKYLGGN